MCTTPETMAASRLRQQQITGLSRINCPADPHSVITVTPPEAIWVAEYIRTYLPEEAVAIQERAQKNLMSAAGTDLNRNQVTAPRCPLLDDNHACLVYSVRPLHCRVDLPSKKQAARSCAGDCGTCSSQATTHQIVAPALPVSQSLERGFSRVLKSRGVDGDRYELNGALVTALEHRDAAERWMNRDSVFKDCPLGR